MSQLTNKELLKIAKCYKDVFNESWGEDWTELSALKEVTKSFEYHQDRKPVAVLLFKNSDVIGFCWGLATDKDCLRPDRDMPFDLPLEQQQEGVDTVEYYMRTVLRKLNLFIIREIGVYKEYRKETGPFLLLPLLTEAWVHECDTATFWTNAQSQGFKWGLGMGLFPLHFFRTDDLLLMLGSVKQAISVFKAALGVAGVEKSNKPVAKNIGRFVYR